MILIVELDPKEERRAAVLAAFARYFGDNAGRPLRYIDHIWQDEPWSRGCYAGVAQPGVQSSVGHTARSPMGMCSGRGRRRLRGITGI